MILKIVSVLGVSMILNVIIPTSVTAQTYEEGVLSCLLEPSQDIRVGIPADGVLTSIKVDRSDRVRQGQLLAELDTRLERAGINIQEARKEFAARRLERAKNLQAAQLIPEQELDELVTEQRLSELELIERREQIRLKQTFSPIDGVVVEKFASTGDLVQKNELLRIMQLDPLYVEVVLSLDWFGKIQTGEQKNVLLQHLDDTVEATVINVDSVIDPASSTFRVRLSLPNPDYRIPSGLRCQFVDL